MKYLFFLLSLFSALYVQAENTTSKALFLPLYKQPKGLVSASATPIIKREQKAWNGITSPSPI